MHRCFTRMCKQRFLVKNIYIPSISHLSPVNPGGQAHTKELLSTLLHLPPLQHGALAHGFPVFMIKKHYKPNCALQYFYEKSCDLVTT